VKRYLPAAVEDLSARTGVIVRQARR